MCGLINAKIVQGDDETCRCKKYFSIFKLFFLKLFDY